MTKSQARQPSGDVRLAMPRSAVTDIIGIFAKHNPSAARAVVEMTGKAAAAFGMATAALTEPQQRRLVARKNELTQIIGAVVDDLKEMSRPSANKLIAVSSSAAMETSAGAGIGKLIGREEGQDRIQSYAKPKRLEEWAGPVAGPGQLERDYGIKRSTLHAWQKRGAIVGLLKGERKHVFPLAQFIDGRPVEGMTRVTKVIGNPRATWRWLTLARPFGDGTSPLDRLKQGEAGEVATLAERDFG